ncbi:HAD-IIA family hydrolase [Brevibacillus ruminantium]|uniref:Acid sugar phosphatase n=1 Tax=Brevibacillus ruminantium TaxID=2950604 RepID=A0ABY4WN91_9BACL|nr:HAD-IIA family hydrolase [Brevibacillus ruminantium]USG68538.1 HAD-IIA family hydrolase [Brevibacillus ruminantium]
MPDAALFDAYFFDLDGTVFIGDQLLPEAAETLAALRESGRKVMFLTNTSVQTRADCLARLHRLGVDAELEEIMTAAYAAGQFLQEQADQALVLVIGETALEKELEGFGIAQVKNPLDATHVLVGMDRQFTYQKLQAGMEAVRNGARLIVTNPDPLCPVPGGAIPDTGALAKAIETASDGQVWATVGKPSAYYAEKVLQRIGLLPERCLMVGDRLETDILLGLGSGMRTALVLTGVTGRSDAEAAQIRPDYILPTMKEIRLGLLGQVAD